MKKQILAVVLAAAMLLGMMVPAAAAAEDGAVTTYAELSAAVTGAAGTDPEHPTVITVGADIDMTDPITIPEGKYVKLTSGTGGPYTIGTSSAVTSTKSAFLVTSGGLELEHITLQYQAGMAALDSTAVIEINIPKDVTGQAAVVLGDGAALKQTGGTIGKTGTNGIYLKRQAGTDCVPSLTLKAGSAIQGFALFGIKTVSVGSGTPQSYPTSFFKMEGGEISGNNMGVYLDYKLDGVMTGGAITGNKKSGVSLGDTTSSRSAFFTLAGGTISKNGDNEANTGEGVFVNTKGTLTMTGGTISENCGHGVNVSGGTFTLESGDISKNVKSGVRVAGTFTMNGGTVSENKDCGVDASPCTATAINGGSIINNTTPTKGGGIGFGDRNESSGSRTLTITGGTITGNHAGEAGGGIYLKGSSNHHLVLDTKAGSSITMTGNTQGSEPTASNLYMTKTTASGNPLRTITVTALGANDAIGVRTADSAAGVISDKAYAGDLPAKLVSDLAGMAIWKNSSGRLSIDPVPDPPSFTTHPASIDRVVAGRITAQNQLTAVVTPASGALVSGGDVTWYRMAGESPNPEADTPLTGGTVTEAGGTCALSIPLPADLAAGADYAPQTYHFYARARNGARGGPASAYAQSSSAAVTVYPARYPVGFTATGLDETGLPALGDTDRALTLSLQSASHYKLPETISVTMGGAPLTAGDAETGYTYDSATGAVTVKPVTGAVTVKANGVLKSADATLKGLTTQVGGGAAQAVAGFGPDKTAYEVTLPCGTVMGTVMTVTGEKSSGLATLEPGTVSGALAGDSQAAQVKLALTIRAECQDSEGEVGGHTPHEAAQTYTVTFTRPQPPTPTAAAPAARLADWGARTVNYTLDSPDLQGEAATPGYKLYSAVDEAGMGTTPETSAAVGVSGTGVTLTLPEADVPRGEESRTYYLSMTLGDNESKCLTLTVQAAPSHTLTVDGTASARQVKEPVTLTAEPVRDRKVFSHWTATGMELTNVDQSTISFAMPDNDVTLTAVYQVKPVTGIQDPGVTDGQVWYLGGEPMALGGTVEPADATYTEIQWTVEPGTTGAAVDGGAFSATAEGTAALVATVRNGKGGSEHYVQRFTVQVKAHRYTVTVSGGSLSGDSATGHGDGFRKGETVSLTATPENGKVFVNWTAVPETVVFGDAGSASTSFTMPAQDVSVTANYKEFIPVSGVDGEIPGMLDIETELDSFALPEGVLPADATCTDLVWTLEPGETGAKLEGNRITAQTAGVVTLTATVYGGGVDKADFTRDYTIQLKVKQTAAIDTAPQRTVYTGEAQSFTVKNAQGLQGFAVSYSADGQPLAAPVNAGVYDVTVTRPGDGNFKPFTVTIPGGLVIEKAAASQVQWPEVGTLTYGQKLSQASLTGGDPRGSFSWTDGDALPQVGGATCTLTFQPNDLGNYDYTGVSLTKEVSLTVQPAPLGGVVSLCLSNDADGNGTASGGDTLTADLAGLLPAGVTGDDVDFQWYDGESAIEGAVGDSYTLTGEETDIFALVSAREGGNYTGQVSSERCKPGAKPLTGSLTIDGGVDIGSVLTVTADLGSASESDYTLQWSRDGQGLQGEDGRTYTLVEDDLGHSLTVTASGVGAEEGGYTGQVGSAPFQVPAQTPAAPGELTAVAGIGQVTLTWSRPHPRGSGIVRYALTVTKDDAPLPGSPFSLAADAETYTLSGVESGAEYVFALKAINAVGESQAARTTAETGVPIPTKPVVTATAGHEKISVVWTAAVSEDSPLTGYQVIVTAAGGAIDGSPFAVSADVTRHSLTGLTNGAAYTIRVKALNEAGGWAESEPVTATPRAPSGGGDGGGGDSGSSSRPSKPTTNPDGSTTTTTRNPDGSTTAVTESKDGGRTTETITKSGTTITATTPADSAAGSTVSTTVKAEVKDGAVKAEVPARDVDALVSAVKDSRAEVITIAPELKEGTLATAATVSLPAGAAARLAQAADVAVATPVGTVTLPAAALAGLGSGKEAVSVTIGARTGTGAPAYAFELKAGDKVMETVSGGVKVLLPVEDATPGTVAVLAFADGTEQIIRKSAVSADGVAPCWTAPPL